MFATAPKNFFIFFDFRGYGRNAGTFVRAVAIRLFATLSASAPVVLSCFYVECERSFASNFWSFHVYIFFGGKIFYTEPVLLCTLVYQRNLRPSLRVYKIPNLNLY